MRTGVDGSAGEAESDIVFRQMSFRSGPAGLGPDVIAGQCAFGKVAQVFAFVADPHGQHGTVVPLRASRNAIVGCAHEGHVVVQPAAERQAAGLGQNEARIPPGFVRISCTVELFRTLAVFGPYQRPEAVIGSGGRCRVIHGQAGCHRRASTACRARAESRSLMPRKLLTMRTRASSSCARSPSARTTSHSASSTARRSS